MGPAAVSDLGRRGPDRPCGGGAAAQAGRPGGADRRAGPRWRGRGSSRWWTGVWRWCPWRWRSRWGPPSTNDITLLAHQEPVFGAAPSDTTVRRALELADNKTLDRIARVRAKVRAHVWSLIAARPAGFPWLAIAGKLLAALAGHRPGRDADHRALREAGRRPHL